MATRFLFDPPRRPKPKVGPNIKSLLGTLSFNVEADRYRKDNRRKTLGNSQTENAKVNLCALRQRSYLDKERRYSGPADVSEPVIFRKFSSRDFPHPDRSD